MTQALLGRPSVFQTGDGNSPEVFTPFPEVHSIVMPTVGIDVIDTSHEMPPLSIRESFPGGQDYGEVKIEFNFLPGDPATAALMTEFANRSILHRRIILADGMTWAFSAYLSDFESSERVDDKLAGTATFQVVGAATMFQGPPPVVPGEFRYFTIGISEIGGPDIIKPG